MNCVDLWNSEILSYRKPAKAFLLAALSIIALLSTTTIGFAGTSVPVEDMSDTEKISAETKLNEDSPARSTKISLTKVEGAKFLEVEIRSLTEKWDQPQRATLPAGQDSIRVRLSPGTYKIRTRSKESESVHSQWSEERSFTISYRPVKGLSPSDKSILQPKGDDFETILLEWPKTSGAEAYLLQIYNPESPFKKEEFLTKTWHKIELPVNSLYEWRVIPLPDKNAASSYLFQNSNQNIPQKKLKGVSQLTIVGPDRTKRKVEIPILHKEPFSRKDHVQKFEFELTSLSSSDSSSPSFYSSSEPKYVGRLSPGEYQLRYRYLIKSDEFSAWQPSISFVVEDLPLFSKAIPAFQAIDATDDEKSEVKLSWELSPAAKTYQLVIFSEDRKLVLNEQVKTSPFVASLPAGKKYYWYAKPSINESPQPSATNFKDASNEVLIRPYAKLDFASAEEASHIYSWLQYQTSSESYAGSNIDDNTRISQSLLGSKVSLGVGYWFREYNIGISFKENMGSLKTSSAEFQYNTRELLFGYRQVLEDGDRLRIWYGFSQKEFPEISRQTSTGSLNFAKLKSWGSTYQLQYLHDLTTKIGLQFWGALYISQFDLGTPNSQKQKPESSTYFGASTSYQWSKNYRFILGYCYRTENFAYQSATIADAANSAKLESHDLSIALEFALSEKAK